MKRAIAVLILLAIALELAIGGVPAPPQDIVYVCGDSPAPESDCGTESAPCASLQQGVAQADEGGVVQVCSSGVMLAAAVEIRKQLTVIGDSEASPITCSAGNAGLEIYNGNVLVQGLRFKQCAPAIRMNNVFEAESQHTVTVQFSHFHNNTRAIEVWSHSLVLSNCSFEGNRHELNGAAVMYANTDLLGFLKISGCSFHNNFVTGRRPNDVRSGLGVVIFVAMSAEFSMLDSSFTGMLASFHSFEQSLIQLESMETVIVNVTFDLSRIFLTNLQQLHVIATTRLNTVVDMRLCEFFGLNITRGYDNSYVTLLNVRNARSVAWDKNDIHDCVFGVDSSPFYERPQFDSRLLFTATADQCDAFAVSLMVEESAVVSGSQFRHNVATNGLICVSSPQDFEGAYFASATLSDLKFVANEIRGAPAIYTGSSTSTEMFVVDVDRNNVKNTSLLHIAGGRVSNVRLFSNSVIGDFTGKTSLAVFGHVSILELLATFNECGMIALNPTRDPHPDVPTFNNLVVFESQYPALIGDAIVWKSLFAGIHVGDVCHDWLAPFTWTDACEVGSEAYESSCFLCSLAPVSHVAHYARSSFLSSWFLANRNAGRGDGGAMRVARSFTVDLSGPYLIRGPPDPFKENTQEPAMVQRNAIPFSVCGFLFNTALQSGAALETDVSIEASGLIAEVNVAGGVNGFRGAIGVRTAQWIESGAYCSATEPLAHVNDTFVRAIGTFDTGHPTFTMLHVRQWYGSDTPVKMFLSTWNFCEDIVRQPAREATIFISVRDVLAPNITIVPDSVTFEENLLSKFYEITFDSLPQGVYVASSSLNDFPAYDSDINFPVVAGQTPSAFYVSPSTGVNTPGCGEPATPCANISQAVAQAFFADTVHLCPETFVITESILATPWVTFQAANATMCSQVPSILERPVLTTNCASMFRCKMNVLFKNVVFNEAHGSIVESIGSVLAILEHCEIKSCRSELPLISAQNVLLYGLVIRDNVMFSNAMIESNWVALYSPTIIDNFGRIVVSADLLFMINGEVRNNINANVQENIGLFKVGNQLQSGRIFVLSSNFVLNDIVVIDVENSKAFFLGCSFVWGGAEGIVDGHVLLHGAESFSAISNTQFKTLGGKTPILLARHGDLLLLGVGFTQGDIGMGDAPLLMAALMNAISLQWTSFTVSRPMSLLPAITIMSSTVHIMECSVDVLYNTNTTHMDIILTRPVSQDDASALIFVRCNMTNTNMHVLGTGQGTLRRVQWDGSEVVFSSFPDYPMLDVQALHLYMTDSAFKLVDATIEMHNSTLSSMRHSVATNSSLSLAFVSIDGSSPVGESGMPWITVNDGSVLLTLNTEFFGLERTALHLIDAGAVLYSTGFHHSVGDLGGAILAQNSSVTLLGCNFTHVSSTRVSGYRGALLGLAESLLPILFACSDDNSTVLIDSEMDSTSFLLAKNSLGKRTTFADNLETAYNATMTLTLPSNPGYSIYLESCDTMNCWVAGTAPVIIFDALDMCGGAMNVGGSSALFSLSSTWSPHNENSSLVVPDAADVIDFNNGTYSLEFNSVGMRAGDWEHTPLFNLVQPYEVLSYTLVPSVASSNSYVTDNAEVFWAWCPNSAFEFHIVSTDEYLNVRYLGGDVFEVEMSGDVSHGPVVIDERNGLYDVVFLVGEDPFHEQGIHIETSVYLVSDDGERAVISNGQFAIYVVPGPVDLAASVAKPVTSVLTAHEVATGEIHLVLEHPLSVECDDVIPCVGVMLSDASGAEIEANKSCTNAESSENIVIMFSATTDVAGAMSIRATYLGDPLPFVPFFVTPVAENSFLPDTFDGMTLNANEEYTVSVVLEDPYGNACGCPGFDGSAVVIVQCQFSAEIYTMRCEENGDTLTADIVISAAGLAVITVSLNETAIGNSDVIGVMNVTVVCAPGYYLRNDDECVMCSKNTYSDQINAGRCIDCPDHASSPSGSPSLDDCGCVEGFYELEDICYRCDLPWWMTDPTRCKGGNDDAEKCSGNYDGEFCLECEDGYYLQFHNCISCGSWWYGVVGLSVFYAIAAGTLLISSRSIERQTSQRFIKIVSLALFFRTQFSHTTKGLLYLAYYVSLNLHWAFFQCYGFPPWLSILPAFFLPVLLLPAVILAVVIRMLYRRLVSAIGRALGQLPSRLPKPQGSVLWLELRDECAVYGSGMLVYTYIPMLVTSLTPFYCAERGDGQLFAAIIPDLQCFGADYEWWLLATLSVVWFVGYGLALPLWWHRRLLARTEEEDDDDETRKKLASNPIGRMIMSTGVNSLHVAKHIIYVAEDILCVLFVMLLPNVIAQCVMIILVSAVFVYLRIRWIGRVRRSVDRFINFSIVLMYVCIALVTLDGMLAYFVFGLDNPEAELWETILGSVAVVVTVAFHVLLSIVVQRLAPRRSREYELARYGTQNGAMNALLQDDDILSSWQIDYDDLFIINPPIAKGTFGIVNKAEYGGTVVAVKTVVVGKQDESHTVSDFLREVKNLCTLHHPNIVLFIGACMSPMCIVVEFVERGSLADVIHNFGGVASHLSDDMDLPGISVEHFLKVAHGAACGMAYLHSHDVLHRDLKSPNILVTGDWVGKITDFGGSRSLASSFAMTSFVGTARWAAPEIHVGEGYDEKVDVYSFAIVLWEMIAGRMPFLDAASDGEVANRVIHGERYVDSVAATASREWMVKGKCGEGVWGDAHLTGSRRPAIPPCCGPRARELIETCWSEDAQTRLSFGEIVQMMHAMQHEAEEDEYLGIP